MTVFDKIDLLEYSVVSSKSDNSWQNGTFRDIKTRSHFSARDTGMDRNAVSRSMSQFSGFD